MQMRFFSAIRFVRVALALAVALWMAGAGCLLGCENMIAAAANHSDSATSLTPSHSLTTVATGDACASVQSHDCCAKHGARRTVSKTSAKATVRSKSDASTSVTGAVDFGPTSTMMDCPLAVNATAALSKAKPDTSPTALAHTSAAQRLPLLQEQASALSAPRLLLNRGHTYLRCCVFLI